MRCEGEGMKKPRVRKPRTKRRTITVDELRRLSWADSPKMPQAVEQDGVRKEWLGIGWIDCGTPHGDEVLVVG